MTTISTGCRLHFGLFNAGHVPGQAQFGGLGMMIDMLRVQVNVQSSETWEARGPECERAMEAARKVADRPFAIEVEACPPLHSGLGVGTQLALAAGRAVANEIGITLENDTLARIVGRGLCSGIGVRGFQSGGFILDHGHVGNDLSPTERFDWPADWRILLVRSHVPPSWHGPAELRAFARQRDRTSIQQTETELRRLAGEVVVALQAKDFEAFGEQLHQFNRLAGVAFSEDQGGTYSSEAVAETVEWFRKRGLHGVGQSSWGPTVFAVVEGARSNDWRDSTAEEFRGKAEVLVTDGANSGFRVNPS